MITIYQANAGGCKRFALHRVMAACLTMLTYSLSHARAPVVLNIDEKGASAYLTLLTPQVREAFERIHPEKPEIVEVALRIREKGYRFGQLYMIVAIRQGGHRVEYLFSPEGKLWATLEKMTVKETPLLVRSALEARKMKRDVVWKWAINNVVHYEASVEGAVGLSAIAIDGSFLGERLTGTWAEPGFEGSN